MKRFKITINNEIYNVKEATKAGDNIYIQDVYGKFRDGDEVYIIRTSVNEPDPENESNMPTRFYGKGKVVGSRAFADPKEFPHSDNAAVIPDLDKLKDQAFDPNGGRTNFAEIELIAENPFENEVIAFEGEFDTTSHSNQLMLGEASEREAELFEEILNRTHEENVRETARAFNRILNG